MTEKFGITVKLATALARHTGNQKQIGCKVNGEDDLASVLNDLEDQFPGIKAKICSADVDLRDSINVYVNGDNVRYLNGLKTALKQGDVVNIIPAVAAG
ncbi:ubiquitin-like small modifier protein 1 [Desulfosarcina ovata]|uniref:MoaD family protein n=2 Tax=Desulfosarcina ovata TaxID=83564 RepID=A0A5K8ALJ6_9BACT|nr:ubiquitin-like small modifier protein 1 [Desulfosarcina ovata]BBO86573.1 MoaD family protein [Desulfosarcina ovata subsp. sediminis]BBO93429.1 MoaD family protein [Desulfosarcina ovata subsp. ovata]